MPNPSPTSPTGNDRPRTTRELEPAFRGLPVLVTGHTGFTGGWLCLWLEQIGARITGLALEPATEPSLFEAAGIDQGLDSRIGNICDRAAVEAAFAAARPAVVFHLAAQPLVSRAFDDPLETFASNVMGAANVLEAARQCPATKAVVCVTTDKVYADQDWHWGYREVDRLGGKDPYSASKAAAELIAATYQRTLAARGNGVAIATARGGNIVGGGDWSKNRIVPDFVRAQVHGTPLVLRNPDAVRPWQHVLALVHGYLMLAACLIETGAGAAGPWNFGPPGNEAKTVGALVEALAASWRRPDVRIEKGSFPETRFLHVDSAKSRTELGWHPPIAFDDTVRLTAEWYRDYYAGSRAARELCLGQIDCYRARLGAAP